MLKKIKDLKINPETLVTSVVAAVALTGAVVTVKLVVDALKGESLPDEFRPKSGVIYL